MAISTMYPAKAGSPKTELAAELSASATSMTLADASVLPPAPNLAVIGDDSSAEVVSYTAINGNVVSGLIRALGGTTASVWASGTDVARNYTSFDHDRFIANIEDLESNKISGVSWGDVNGTLADQEDLQNALDTKQDALTFDQTPTPSSTNPVESGGVYEAIEDHAPFLITGTASAGSAVTITDTRINSEHWRVPENGITFGTPTNVTTGGTWTTNVENHTITINATFTGATTVTINMVWFQ